MTEIGHDPLVGEIRSLRRELDALYGTALAIHTDDGVERALDAIVRHASGLIDDASGYAALVVEPGALEVCATVGPSNAMLNQRVGPGEGLAGTTWQSGRATTGLEDCPTESGDAEPLVTACVPLTEGFEVVGVLAIQLSGRSFAERELAVLERFTRLASLALERARHHSTMQSELAARAHREHELEQRLESSEHEVARRLAAATEFRDVQTGRHVERVGDSCQLIAEQLGLDAEFCRLIRVAAPLHDIGKIGVPDDVLLKPGLLTNHERMQIEEHPEIGHRILAGAGSPLLQLAASIALTHHERYDGSGYPHGLRGSAIPIEGRIAAVADVFDALTSERVYREPYSVGAALEMMREGRGTQFDPDVLDALFSAVEATDDLSIGAAQHTPARR